VLFEPFCPVDTVLLFTVFTVTRVYQQNVRSFVHVSRACGPCEGALVNATTWSLRRSLDVGLRMTDTAALCAAWSENRPELGRRRRSITDEWAPPAYRPAVNNSDE